MKYLSVCSGIEAATCAWHPLGWSAFAFSEIEQFPSQVLAHHYPEIPNLGDMTRFKGWPDAAIDVLVGGTPCQSFSVAGLRAGLRDPRGNLMLTYLAIAAKYRPRWLVWENVPGVLSSNGGRDFGSLLGGMAKLGYGFAYRVLDAQYVRVDSHARAVPQRRRRVFVVGYFGDWRRAAAVFFERESLSGNPAPRREAREGTSAGSARSLAISGREGVPSAELGDDIANAILTPSGGRAGIGVGAILHAPPVSLCLNAGAMGRQDSESETLIPTIGGGFDVAHAIQAGALRENPSSGPDGVGVQEGCAYTLEARAEVQAVAFGFNARQDPDAWEERCGPLDTDGSTQAVAFAQNSRDEVRLFGGDGQTVGALAAEPGMKQTTYIATTAVRRLTPRECERLQGFPDDFTLIPVGKKLAADGPRYKALGNSMAVNVMRWIGGRITLVESISARDKAA